MSKGRSQQSVRSQATSATRTVGALTVDASAHSIEVEISKLDEPTSEYDADFGWMEYHGGTVSLLFGKRSRETSGRLASRLELRVGAEDMCRTVNGSHEFFEQLRTRASHWTQSLRVRPARATKDPADRSHSQWATYFYIGYSGSKAIIDAYHLSVAGLSRFVMSNERDISGLKLRGVVRINISVFDLAVLLEELKAATPSIQSEMVESKLLPSADLESEHDTLASGT
jgi:hypothetical protein